MAKSHTKMSQQSLKQPVGALLKTLQACEVNYNTLKSLKMIRKIKSQRSFKTSLQIRQGFIKMMAKTKVKKTKEGLKAHQHKEMPDKAVSTEPETFQKRPRALQHMSHTEGRRVHQGLHHYKGVKRVLHLDPHLHTLLQNYHKPVKIKRSHINKDKMIPEISAGTDIKIDITEAIQDQIKEALTDTGAIADKDNQVENDEIIQMKEADLFQGPVTIVTEQTRHSDTETDQMRAVDHLRIETMAGLLRPQASTNLS